MKKVDLLDYLSFGSVSAKDVADRFGVSLGSVYNALTSLNIQGLVRKVRGDDGLLIYSITDRGRDRLDYLSEEENKPSGGSKMSRLKRQFLDDGIYECPECGCKYDLQDVSVDSKEALCEDCEKELQFVEPFEDEDDE